MPRPAEPPIGPLGEEIDAIRRETRDSVEDFAARLGVSQELATKYRRGVTAPGLRAFERWGRDPRVKALVPRLREAAAAFRKARDAEREQAIGREQARLVPAEPGIANARARLVVRFEAIAEHVEWDETWLSRKLAQLADDAADKAGRPLPVAETG